jgi:hypothetical protein
MDTDSVEEVRKWVRDVCGLPDLPEFPKDFQDGTLLCKLANALKPGAIPKVRHVGGSVAAASSETTVVDVLSRATTCPFCLLGSER